MKNLRFVAFSGLLVVQFAAGQSFTASILGTVKDASGGVVPRATISIVNTGTNARAEAASDAGGYYIAPLLPPGRYRLEAAAPGFKRFVREGIVLQVNEQARIDISLAVGEVAESVTVDADAPLLESTTSTIGKVVDNARIVNMPLNTRNVYGLIFLTPGVAGSVAYNYGEMRYSVNGARPRTMDTLIDGVTANHPTVTGGSGISVFPSVDAIEEFKVMGANYQAEFGHSLGNVLNVVYKSGTNAFHGGVFEFLRNSVLDSNNFFDNRRGRKLASFKRSQFGGTVTGPIRRDQTFFMGNFEGLRQFRFANRTFTTPTALERQGDFARTFAPNGQLVRIFDPFTTRANPAGGFLRDPLEGNLVPPSRFDPVAANVVKFYPLPNTPGDPITNTNNYSLSGSAALNLDQFDVRIDHHISSQQRFFARYSHRLIQDRPPIYFPKDLAIAEGRINQQDRVRGAVADYTHTLSPTAILTTRLGFSRTLFVYDNQGLGFLPSTLGLPRDIDAAVDRQMFPAFGVSGYTGLGGNDHRWNAFMTYTALANLTKIHGPHTLKFGFEGRLTRVNVWEARDAGSFSFSAGMTQGPNPNQASVTAGNGLASLLLGAGSGGNLIQAWKNVAAQSLYYAGFIQDDWRVAQKLTLNLGLRYDLETPRTERYNRMNYFDPFAVSPLARQTPQFPDLRGGLVFVGVDGRGRSQYPTDINNLAPRAGLAYQLSPRTVIRAGYGHSFGQAAHAAHGTVGPFGFRLENPWVTSLDGITPFNLLRNPFPQGFRSPPGASEGLLTGVGGNIQAVLQDTLNPWAMQWSFSVQRELPSQILLEVAYVGARGLHLTRNTEGGLDLNQVDPRHLALGSQLNQQVDNPFFGRITTGALRNQRIGRNQLLRPYPQFLNAIPLFSSGSSSTYHSLQVTTSKRLSHGLQFEGSYTWAKNLDNADSHQDSYNIRASRSLTSIDLAHRFVIGYVYELPFGRGRRFGSDLPAVFHALFGGWQFNGITLFQTGTPIGIGASNTINLFTQAARANNNGSSGKLSGQVDKRLDGYFDRSVFSQPAPFTFGNLGPRLPDIRTDAVRNFDLSLFKEFRPVERLTVQFRSEFFNTFNTPRFSGPDTGATSRTFGVINSQANDPRQIQFGLKLLW